MGTLTRHEPWNEELLKAQYKDEEGKTFLYIHQIANFFIKEERLAQYKRYAILALALRGMFWWGLVYGTASMFGIVSVLEAIAIIVALGVGFPVACWLGKL